MQGTPEYRDEWYGQQCLFCQYYCPLTSELGLDFGACTNPASDFDGRVMFEHDGCKNYVEDEDLTS